MVLMLTLLGCKGDKAEDTAGWSGDITLASDAEMSAFCAASSTVSGDLTLSGISAASLSSLSCLTEIDGNLTILSNPGLTDIGLDNLSTLGFANLLHNNLLRGLCRNTAKLSRRSLTV